MKQEHQHPVKCLICNQDSKSIFSATIRAQYSITYFYCRNCGFLQTEYPYWLAEAYREPINPQDTGYLSRNIGVAHKISIFLLLSFGSSAHFLDYAGGYGVFVRLMRDKGFNFYWQDKYTENIFAKGFHRDAAQDELAAITSLESLEHFPNPMEELEYIFSLTSTFIFTTELLSKEVPAPGKWQYYGLEHGQHISFYSSETLRYIASHFEARLLRLGSICVITKNRRVRLWKLAVSILLGKSSLHSISKCFLKSKTLEDSLDLNGA
jgi:hypothetical protein